MTTTSFLYQIKTIQFSQMSFHQNIMYLEDFFSVIKSAASAASPTAWELLGSAPRPSPASRSRRPGAPMQLPSGR